MLYVLQYLPVNQDKLHFHKTVYQILLQYKSYLSALIHELQEDDVHDFSIQLAVEKYPFLTLKSPFNVIIH